MRKFLLLFLVLVCTSLVSAQEFVDLGLSSGTQWCSQNESGFYTLDDANSMFGSNLPNEHQWNELLDECEWKYENQGYRIIGPNGKYIRIPFSKFYRCGEKNYIIPEATGYYWVRDGGYNNAFAINAETRKAKEYIVKTYRNLPPCMRFPVRLVR